MKYNELEKWEYLKGFYRYKLDNKDASRNDYNCVKELKSYGIKGSIHIPKKDIDIKSLGFDDAHINKERNHNVSEKEAKKYIQTAVLSITKRNGLSENYYSKSGFRTLIPLKRL